MGYTFFDLHNAYKHTDKK